MPLAAESLDLDTSVAVAAIDEHHNCSPNGASRTYGLVGVDNHLDRGVVHRARPTKPSKLFELPDARVRQFLCSDGRVDDDA